MREIWKSPDWNGVTELVGWDGSTFQRKRYSNKDPEAEELKVFSEVESKQDGWLWLRIKSMTTKGNKTKSLIEQCITGVYIC